MVVTSHSLRPRRRRLAVHPNSPTRRRGLGADQFPVPPSLSRPKRVFVNCHYCGYSPPEVPPNGLCPKCGRYSWERFALSIKVLPKK